MRKQGVAKPVNGKHCDKCDYYNPKKKRCILKTCIDQLTLFDAVGNRF